jgi:transcriptional regulator with XRE-family HTH domain
VEEQLALSFAGLLRRLRDGAGLTQEELAEAASLSPRSVSDLERGIHRTARKETALLLAGALGLVEPARGLFVAAARGKVPAAEALAAGQQVPGTFAAAATRSLPRDIAGFTGRQAELAQLLTALTAAAGGGGVVNIHAIDGMAGIGKTTLAVHAAHRLAAAFPDGQFFLPMHAHTPGQRPVEPADALASLLLTAGVPAALVRSSCWCWMTRPGTSRSGPCFPPRRTAWCWSPAAAGSPRWKTPPRSAWTPCPPMMRRPCWRGWRPAPASTPGMAR